MLENRINKYSAHIKFLNLDKQTEILRLDSRQIHLLYEKITGFDWRAVNWDEYFFIQWENKKEQTDHVCRKQGATRIKSSQPPWWNLNPLWKGKKKTNIT